jgi:hypothetical protein
MRVREAKSVKPCWVQRPCIAQMALPGSAQPLDGGTHHAAGAVEGDPEVFEQGETGRASPA